MKISVFFRKIISKLKSSIYVFKKAEILENVLKKEINGEYDYISLSNSCDIYKIKNFKDNISVAVYLGGALGDYIVYLNFIDELVLSNKISLTIFLDRIGFANYVFGRRKNVNIIHDVDNYLFINGSRDYDLSLHFDHGITIHHSNLPQIKLKSYDFYIFTCQMLEYVKKTRVDISEQQLRQIIIFKKAQFSKDNKWSKLSAGGILNMNNMYSSILIYSEYFYVLDKYKIKYSKYITVNYGADKNMGGESQTKVVPAVNFESFIDIFRQNYPDYNIVQTGTKNSTRLRNCDVYAFDCSLDETAVILKKSLLHIDSEGGLVHLASQLSTKCIVGFGPTPSYYYGYDRNINIVPDICNNCMSATNDWNLHCPKGQHHPECVYSITGDVIFQKTDEYLKSMKNINTELSLSINNKKTLENELDSIFFERKYGMNISVITKQFSKVLNSFPTSKNNITVYILPSTSENIKNSLNWEQHIRSKKIKLRYGSGFNIACLDNSYDLILFDCNILLENEFYFFEYCFKELVRISNNNSNILIYGDNLKIVLSKIKELKIENLFEFNEKLSENIIPKFLKISIKKENNIE